MKSIVGWEVVCDSKHRAWVNGQPVQCQHRHRTQEALHACVVKRLMAGDLEDVTLNVQSGKVTLPMGKAPRPKTVSQHMTLKDLEEALAQHGIGIQNMSEGKGTPLWPEGPHGPGTLVPYTLGSVRLSSIVNALNLRN